MEQIEYRCPTNFENMTKEDLIQMIHNHESILKELIDFINHNTNKNVVIRITNSSYYLGIV